MTDLLLASNAIISPCKTYRYRLERETGSGSLVAAGIMVNPSTADAENNDHTIRKWLGFSQEYGFKKFIIGNKFAHRSKDIRGLRTAVNPIGPDNDKHLEQILRDADVHIVAWGSLSKLPPELRGRWREVVAIADRVGCKLLSIGPCAGDGHPKHPLTLSYKLSLTEWVRPG
jgi:hypothetical protein